MTFILFFHLAVLVTLILFYFPSCCVSDIDIIYSLSCCISDIGIILFSARCVSDIDLTTRGPGRGSILTMFCMRGPGPGPSVSERN